MRLRAERTALSPSGPEGTIVTADEEAVLTSLVSRLAAKLKESIRNLYIGNWTTAEVIRSMYRRSSVPARALAALESSILATAAEVLAFECKELADMHADDR